MDVDSIRLFASTRARRRPLAAWVETLEPRVLLADGITSSGVGTIHAATGVALTNVRVATFTVDTAAGSPGSMWRSRILWGDGNDDELVVPTLVSGNVWQFAGTHTYASSGNFTITVMIAVPGSHDPSANNVTDSVVVTAPPPAPNAPALSAASDTGVSPSDGITRNNGSAAAPLVFTVGGVNPANGFVQLYNDTNPASPVPLGGPVQATGGAATITLNGAPLPDGAYQVAATTAATAGGLQSALSAPTRVAIQTSLTIASTNPADGSVVSALPGGQVIVTFSHPLAGLTDGQSPIRTTAPFNPYDVFLLARGPDGTFSAPAGVDQGDLPLHANVVYHVNGNGTAEFVLTPTEPRASDVYAISVSLPTFNDLAGNALTGPGNGFRTFLLRRPPVNPAQPLTVTGVTAFNGTVAINNNAPVPQPDTIQVHFNKPLFAGAAQHGHVQLIANPGPNFSVVPAVAAYSPTTDSIYLTPTVPLSPGTQYAVRVAGQDSGTEFVSDDQGLGGPGAPLPATVYDLFRVSNTPAGAGQPPFQIATSAGGAPALLPVPSGTSEWSVPVGYASLRFTEPLNTASLGHFSAMLIPRAGGLDTSNFDPADVPLNATVAFNPNTNQLVIVPSQPVGNDVYLYELGGMTDTHGNPLLNNSGQPAGVSGNAPYFATFGLAVPGQSAPEHATPVPLAAAAPAAIDTSTRSVATARRTVPRRPRVRAPIGMVRERFFR